MFFLPFINASMLLKIVITSAAVLVGVASYTWLKQPHDNPIEELSEYVIESQTGFDIDLSFTSKEKK